MINFYKTVNNQIKLIDEYEPNCWVNVVSPTQSEIDYLINELDLDYGFVKSSLDEEESSRIEKEEEQTLIIIDTPFAVQGDENTMLYTTMPIGIIIAKMNIVTVCLKETAVISEIEQGFVKNIQTNLKTRFLLVILLRVAAKYLQYLKQIDKISDVMEKQLRKSMKNNELLQMYDLEKSLVYFSTSLKSNEITLEKILRGRVIKLYEQDEELLEDVLIEIKQAIETSNIYSRVLSHSMNAFASIISNNLNIVMKVLTIITILMAVPTMISSFYGMNVEGLPIPQFWFTVILSLVLTGALTIILIKTKMFK